MRQEDSIENPLQSEDEEIIEPFFEFALPDTYRNSTFARRLASEGSSSPPSLPHQLSSLSLVGGGRSATRHSTVDDTDGL